MTAADERLRAVLSRLDAPAEDSVFVASVMARAAHTAQARPQGMPAFLRPFALIACLVALGAVAPMLAGGLNAALAASDAQVLTASLALVATTWLLMNAFARSARPLFAR